MLYIEMNRPRKLRAALMKGRSPKCKTGPQLVHGLALNWIRLAFRKNKTQTTGRS